MLEAYLRPIYQSCVVNPIAKRTKQFSPDFITYLACLSGILVAPLLALHFPFFATVFLLLSGFLDTLDGTIARLRNLSSEAGTALDVLSDRIVELAVIIGLFAIDPQQRGWFCLAMLGSCYLCITCYLAIAFSTKQKLSAHFSPVPGIFERSEAFAFFILMIWLPKYFDLLAILFSTAALLLCYLHLKQFLQNKDQPTYEQKIAG